MCEKLCKLLKPAFIISSALCIVSHNGNLWYKFMLPVHEPHTEICRFTVFRMHTECEVLILCPPPRSLLYYFEVGTGVCMHNTKYCMLNIRHSDFCQFFRGKF